MGSGAALSAKRSVSTSNRWMAIPLTVLTIGAFAPRCAEAQSDSRRAVEAARDGGVVLLCRHAETDSFREREPVDYDDPTTQRRLDAGGEDQSRRIGAAWARLGIRVRELIASPMDRARRTAELMVDQPVQIDSIWHTNGSDYSGDPLEARRAFLSRPVAGDGVVVIVSHIGTMASVLPEIRGDVGKGDCVVVRPAADGPVVVGVVESEDWRAP